MSGQPRGPRGTYYGVPLYEQAEIYLENAWHEKDKPDAVVRALVGIGFALLAIEHKTGAPVHPYLMNPYPERSKPEYCWKNWPPVHSEDCGCEAAAAEGEQQ